MATITIGLGVVRTPKQERELRKAAADLPDDWAVRMSGDSKTGIFALRIEGPHINGSTTFGPDDADSAVRFLQELKSSRL